MDRHEPAEPGAPAVPETEDASLAFTPVPRRTQRVDGWTAERQHAFIQALARCGSVRRAAGAIGMAAWGAEQLRKHPQGASFAAAWDAALALAAARGKQRLAIGLDAVAQEEASWTPAPAPWSRAATRNPHPSMSAAPPDTAAAPDAAREAAQKAALLADILRKYQLKVRQERDARRAGQIVTADFYLRQLTFLEVALDLTSGDGFALLAQVRCDGHTLIDIAETPMSRLLGQARRQVWAESGEPAGPDHPPAHLLHEHDGYSTEPGEVLQGGTPLSLEEQRRRFDERHAEDAKKQAEWEAAARRDHEARREAPQPKGEEPGKAGRRAPEE